MSTTVHAPSPTRPRPRQFVLWREVLVAYVSPAVTAGAGGLISGQPGLLLAAFTSIAGTSAVVAAALGLWLQRRGVRRAWTTTAPRPVLIVWFVVVTAAVTGLLAWLALGWLPDRLGPFGGPLPTRIQWDLPLSGAVAATIICWRWRGARRRIERADRPAADPMSGA
ncbi:hypothetical protein Lfu02_04910 [Longispora fulva]|uniref:Membrane associated rhomboid family serine protease n=1 Tax=Longispora fulva TaxID=619741 RepID=A0A8J7KNW4_9ACTN|nr:hypothetical protein [Longispora fulva]MBG6135642.1 membrane associated rhomboid family serine protease [Longispora fulva]GIG56119.1 hypothetical protein Lfu02_04910 [Longispora fulva]